MAHVLVIQHEQDSLDFMVQFLQCEGYTVSAVMDERALALSLQDKSLEAIIVDESMLRIRGIHHLVSLRTLLVDRDIPLILLTVNAVPDDKTMVPTLDVYHTFHKANLKLINLAQTLADLILAQQT